MCSVFSSDVVWFNESPYYIRKDPLTWKISGLAGFTRLSDLAGFTQPSDFAGYVIYGTSTFPSMVFKIANRLTSRRGSSA